MNEQQVIRRQIELKKQAKDVIKAEIIDLQIRLALIAYKMRLENHMGKGFNPELSRRLDCINYLLESDDGFQTKSKIQKEI